jgi:hypothetical protein
MTRKDRSVFRYSNCNHAASYLRDAVLAFDRAAKARSSRARRRAKVEAKSHAVMFLFWLSKIEGKPTKVLCMIGKAMEGKLRLPQRVRPNDDIEKAATAVLLSFGGNMRRLTKGPFSLRQFKQELARERGVTPKELREPDSFLRRTLKRRDYKVSGKSGRPKKSPRLPTE